MKRWQGTVAAIAGIVLLTFVGSWVADNSHARGVHMIVHLSLKRVPADNATWEYGTVRITESNGRPRVHDLLEFADYSFDTGGTLAPYEAYTDTHGMVSFKFLPAQANPFVPTKPASILVTDQSLGSLLEYDKNFQITIDTFDPAAVGKGSHG